MGVSAIDLDDVLYIDLAELIAKIVEKVLVSSRWWCCWIELVVLFPKLDLDRSHPLWMLSFG